MGGVRDLAHVNVAGGDELLCLWPRHGGVYAWGREMLVAFMESPCRYKHPPEAARDHTGIWKRGYLRLRRSLDGGQTWSDDGKAFDNSQPYERQRRILRLDEFRPHTGPVLERLDMSGPDAVFLMGRAWCGEDLPTLRTRGPVVYCLRSTDRGRHWDETPAVLRPARSRFLIHFANNNLRTKTGRLICWVAGEETPEAPCAAAGCGPQLYASDNEGAEWLFLSEIWNDPAGRIRASYPHLIVLPSGRWLCFMECRHVSGDQRTPWTAVCSSDDEGLNWTAPRALAAWTHAPFPLRLADGRILVIYMRCAPDPTGLYLIYSEDDGVHWSTPQLLRGDGLQAGPHSAIDGAYPVALSLDGQRVFVVYGWETDEDDVPWYGGRSRISGTYFTLA